MSVVLSSAVSAAGAHEGVSLTNAQIGYDTFTRTATITASSEQTDFPASALANGLSYDYWKPDAGGTESFSYLGNSFDASSQLSGGGTCLAFKTDGTKVYVADRAAEVVYQYSLSTAWDVTTATYDSKSIDVSADSADPEGLFFKDDGTKMYVSSRSSSSVNQYSLSTPWDVSTATFDSVSLTPAGIDTLIGLHISSDGVQVYFINYESLPEDATVLQYTMSTAWDMSTATDSGNTLVLQTGSLSLYADLCLSSDGSTLYCIRRDNDDIESYALSTAYDVSTATGVGSDFSVSSFESGPGSLFIGDDDNKLFVSGDSEFIYEIERIIYAQFTSTSAVSVDYCGIAHHNLGTEDATVYVEYSTDSGSSWTEAISASPSDNSPLLFLFGAISAADWRIRVTGPDTFRIASVYLGEALGMQRSIYGGHSPITLSRNTSIRPNRSEGGGWLGRSIIRRGFSSSFSWRHLKASWYRANFDPFVEAARRYPFFIAWKPQDYPDEVVYGWTNSDIAPSNMGVKDYMEVSMDVEGLYELES